MARTRKNRQFAKPEHFEELTFVTTIPQICRLFHVSPRTVRDAITFDRLAATQEGKIWLVSFNSALELWGAKIPSKRVK